MNHYKSIYFLISFISYATAQTSRIPLTLLHDNVTSTNQPLPTGNKCLELSETTASSQENNDASLKAQEDFLKKLYYDRKKARSEYMLAKKLFWEEYKSFDLNKNTDSFLERVVELHAVYINSFEVLENVQEQIKKAYETQ